MFADSAIDIPLSESFDLFINDEDSLDWEDAEDKFSEFLWYVYRVLNSISILTGTVVLDTLIHVIIETALMCSFRNGSSKCLISSTLISHIEHMILATACLLTR